MVVVADGLEAGEVGGCAGAGKGVDGEPVPGVGGDDRWAVIVERPVDDRGCEGVSPATGCHVQARHCNEGRAGDLGIARYSG